MDEFLVPRGYETQTEAQHTILPLSRQIRMDPMKLVMSQERLELSRLLVLMVQELKFMVILVIRLNLLEL